MLVYRTNSMQIWRDISNATQNIWHYPIWVIIPSPRLFVLYLSIYSNWNMTLSIPNTIYPPNFVPVLNDNAMQHNGQQQELLYKCYSTMTEYVHGDMHRMIHG